MVGALGFTATRQTSDGNYGMKSILLGFVLQFPVDFLPFRLTWRVKGESTSTTNSGEILQTEINK